MTELVLSEVQTGALKSLTVEERKEYDGLKTNVERTAWLDTLVGVLADATTLAGVELTEVSINDSGDRDEYPLFKPGMGILRVGVALRAQFLGTVPMFTNKPKENWAEEVIDGVKWYFSNHYLFRRTDGSLFGLYDSPMLRVLRKLHTKFSEDRRSEAGVAITRLCKEDPTVEIVYRGKIEGKEEILKMFPNFKLQKGNTVHGFNVRIGPGAKQGDRYSRDIVNLTKNPRPTSRAKDGEQLSLLDVASRSWSDVETGTRTQLLDAPAQ